MICMLGENHSKLQKGGGREGKKKKKEKEEA